MLTLRPFVSADTEDVVALWQRCGLVHRNNDPRKDIARKLRVRPDLFLVGTVDGAIVASIMIGYEGRPPRLDQLPRGRSRASETRARPPVDG